MRKILFAIIGTLMPLMQTFAIDQSDIGFSNSRNGLPEGSILQTDGSSSLIPLLTLVQSALLRVVLPIVVVGASLYIAYQLFTAEGDETRMKKAWKSVAYTAIALIAIATSYAFVSIASRISL